MRTQGAIYSGVVLAAVLAACSGGVQGSTASSAAIAAEPNDNAPMTVPGTQGPTSPYGNGDLSLASPDGGVINPFLTDGSAILKALDAIEARNGKPLRATQFGATSGTGMRIELQEPNHPVNVDAYDVRPDGQIVGPRPVRLSTDDGSPVTAADVDHEVFDPRKFALLNLHRAIRQAVAKSKLSDAYVTQWDFGKKISTIFLKSSRGEAQVSVKPDLSIQEITY